MIAACGSYGAGAEPISYRKRFLRNLRALGVIRTRPEEFEGLEDAMLGTMSPVAPSSGFRSRLRDNLALAARQRSVGLAVEYPAPVRQGIILGLSAGVAAAMVALLLILWQSRRSGATR
ncbi:MAG: hypothetical protein V1772_12465 [Chloroflexota bacterium]